MLILKEEHPETLSNFRLLSLSNIVYKLISKVNINRIKGVWKTLISPNQASFVPGR